MTSSRSGLQRVGSWLWRIARWGVAIALVVYLVRAFDSRRAPDLSPWHSSLLDSEFEAGDADQIRTLADYRELEDRLFEELSQRLERDPEPDEEPGFNRFVRGSRSHPGSFSHDWNRTFERSPAGELRGGALLLHGLTDSPYSLRSLAELLVAEGYYVLGLRLPGHGTHPGGLIDVRYEDWLAATRIGARHVSRQVGADKPLVVAGYSAGGALAIDHTLASLEDDDIRIPDRLLLLSPAVGVSATGAIGSWHEAVAWIPYFEKFRWVDVLPEYDPFKYNSFSKNAGRQIYRLTVHLAAELFRTRDEGALERFPPTLTFQSLIDTTVSTRAVVDQLYSQLGSPRHALVIFDVNRSAQMQQFLRSGYRRIASASELGDASPYRMTLVTNRDERSLEVVAREFGARPGVDAEEPTGKAWPPGVYSLSHVALPFPANDVLYGVEPNPDARGTLRIGTLTPRGERNMLLVSMNMVMRLRYNPFHDYMGQRVREWLP